MTDQIDNNSTLESGNISLAETTESQSASETEAALEQSTQGENAVASDPVASPLSDEGNEDEADEAGEPEEPTSGEAELQWRPGEHPTHGVEIADLPDGRVRVRPTSYHGPEFDADDEESALAQVPKLY